MVNFWLDLPKPFFVLAPMEDVTDMAFRQMVATTCKPDVLFTEFANTDGIMAKTSDTSQRLCFTSEQRPIVAQLWGKSPESMAKAVKLVSELGFDGVDINMGCPQEKVVKIGGGIGMAKDPALARELVISVKENCELPVSIKTRLGYSGYQLEDWIGFLLTLDIQALTVHGRTKKQMSKGEANWDEISKCVELRNKLAPKTTIIGNGDVKDYSDGLFRAEKYGVDGVMIGRGIFSNLFAFAKTKPTELSISNRLELLEKHLVLFEKYVSPYQPINYFKHFIKIYINNFDGASDIRQEIMSAKTSAEMKGIINKLTRDYER